MASPTPPARSTKAATLSDVGREAGVSPMAASAVLNGARTTARISAVTRQRVLEAAQRLQYRADATARALASRRTNTLGIAATLLGSEPNLYFLEVFNGVLQGAATAGQNTTVFTLDGWGGATAQRIAGFCDGRIDGLILLAPMLHDTPLPWLPAHTPVVSIHANRRMAGVVNLASDEEPGAFQAVTHLLALGHRRILHLGGPADSSGADLRLHGYLRAHQAAGIAPPDQHVVRCAFDFEAGRQAMSGWLAQHRGEALPDAVFAGSDAIALGCIDTLLGAGLRVPQDVSVVGFDDTALARTSRLATVRQPLQQLGHRAAATLLSLVEARHAGSPVATPGDILLPTEIVPRATLGSARNWPRAID